MSRIYLAGNGALAVLSPAPGAWTAEQRLEGKDCRCLAVDPHDPARVYCGTFTEGVFRSDDGGESWRPVGAALPHQAVTALAVSPLEEAQGNGVLWTGTEPSALFRSENGGESWRELTGLQEIPSKPEWSFPPRPWTHHVRWIEPDPNVAERIYVGIELGGVMRSVDGGASWEDHKPGAQPDCHTLRTHPLAPGAVWESAGGGFAESHDGGETWGGHDEGLTDRYLWGLAVDPGDPGTLVVSSSPGARAAHTEGRAEAALFRREGGGAWQRVRDGLPKAEGTRAYVLACDPAEPGVFFAASGRSVWRSEPGGARWSKLATSWPDDESFEGTNAMVVVSDG